MATLAAFIADFLGAERPVGTVLDGDTVTAQAVAATRFYAGYAVIASQVGVMPTPDVSGLTELSLSEWAVIRPLFLLYIERENALYLEASKMLGMDPYGRSSAEVDGDIAQAEAELPHKAFCQVVVSI